MVGSMENSKIKSYRRSFEKYDGGIQSLQWTSYKSAALRFANLVKDVNLDNRSVLDVGCGFGDLVPFIASKTLHFEYTGVDLMNEFIAEAKKRYPEFEFKAADFFSQSLGTFDIVFCSGALNGKSENVIGDRKQKIKKMFRCANEALVFNMAGGFKATNLKSSQVYYADSLHILAYCMTLTPKIIFRHHYRKNDFTIVMYK